MQYLENYSTDKYVQACSQEPVDSTDANFVVTSTCLETTQQEMTNFTVRLLIESDWSMFSCTLECSKQLPLRKCIMNWGGCGIISMLKSLQIQLQRRHKQQCLKIDTLLWRLMFPDGHFNASSANRRQYAGAIFGTPGTAYLCYSFAVSPNVYAVFPPHLSIQVYLSSDNC